MSDAIWIAAIAAIPPTLTALAALLATLRNQKKIEQVRHENATLAKVMINGNGAGPLPKSLPPGTLPAPNGQRPADGQQPPA